MFFKNTVFIVICSAFKPVRETFYLFQVLLDVKNHHPCLRENGSRQQNNFKLHPLLMSYYIYNCRLCGILGLCHTLISILDCQHLKLNYYH